MIVPVHIRSHLQVYQKDPWYVYVETRTGHNSSRAGLYARIHTLAGLSTQFEPPDHDTPTIHTEIRNCLGHGVFG